MAFVLRQSANDKLAQGFQATPLPIRLLELRRLLTLTTPEQTVLRGAIITVINPNDEEGCRATHGSCHPPTSALPQNLWVKSS